MTGGAQGIGRAVVERFLASGASVAIWDMDGDLTEQTRSELEEQGHVIACQVDVTDPGAVEGAVAETAAAFGKIDVLVCNAGIAGQNATTWDYPVEEWKPGVIDIDLNGVLPVLPGRGAAHD